MACLVSGQVAVLPGQRRGRSVKISVVVSAVPPTVARLGFVPFSFAVVSLPFAVLNLYAAIDLSRELLGISCRRAGL